MNSLDRESSSNVPLEPTSHFAQAHKTNDRIPNLSHKDHSEGHSLTWRHLIKAPVIRQWLHRGQLYKGTKMRQATYVELFFDLMFVGVIHQLADGAIEPKASGLNVAKFALLFYPSWSIWSSVRDFVNASGTDDVLQRLYVLFNMVLLVGYSANATGIEIDEEHHIEPSTYPAIHAATEFILIAKALRLVMFLIYIMSLPKFAQSLSLAAIQHVIPCLFWLPLAFIPEGNDTVVVVLATTAIAAVLALKWLFALVNRWMNQRPFTQSWYTPALNVEHMIERITSFVVIVLGESIINSTFVAHGNDVGFHGEWGRAALAIIIAFEIMWLYFDADSSRVFIHALRRSWQSSILYTQLHWPLCGALILTSAAQKKMILSTEVEQGLRWYFSGGLATAIAITAIIGWTHGSLDRPGSALLPRWFRLGLRLAVALLFGLLPLTKPHSTTLVLGYHSAVLALLILIETVGKLRAEGEVDFNNIEMESADTKSRSKARAAMHIDELTEAEKGEEDAGVEGGLTDIQVRTVRKGQHLAYAA